MAKDFGIWVKAKHKSESNKDQSETRLMTESGNKQW